VTTEPQQLEVALPTNYADTAPLDDPGEGAGTGAASASDDDDELCDDVHDGSGPPFYMTLGVSVDATTDEIRRAYGIMPLMPYAF
jgi:DnaJ-class molecular chaperone